MGITGVQVFKSLLWGLDAGGGGGGVRKAWFGGSTARPRLTHTDSHSTTALGRVLLAFPARTEEAELLTMRCQAVRRQEGAMVPRSKSGWLGWGAQACKLWGL
jgi:hypothetical protein